MSSKYISKKKRKGEKRKSEKKTNLKGARPKQGSDQTIAGKNRLPRKI